MGLFGLAKAIVWQNILEMLLQTTDKCQNEAKEVLANFSIIFGRTKFTNQ
jgi:hypothetical protein